jgi:hypothetical protein
VASHVASVGVSKAVGGATKSAVGGATKSAVGGATKSAVGGATNSVNQDKEKKLKNLKKVSATMNLLHRGDIATVDPH